MWFDFLKKYPFFNDLYFNCKNAEETADSFPPGSGSSVRNALEFVVKLLWKLRVDPKGVDDYTLDHTDLADLLKDYRFVKYINSPALINTYHYVRKTANKASHYSFTSPFTSIMAHQVLDGLKTIILDFAARFQLKTDPIITEKDPIAELAKRMRKVPFDYSPEVDDELNRRLFLTACLCESNWPIVDRDNTVLASSAAVNMKLDDGSTIDYILYGKDSRPVAVIDYTLSKQDLVAGRNNAVSAAEKLAKKYGRKPIVYYTDGYYIYCIDQLGFPPRRVFQFHSIEELELLIWRAGNRKDINDPLINEEICGRPYQHEAIRAACSAYSANHRGALLVMATGTGKTRTAISLADILMKANWAKNILFLADRISLVVQAQKNFVKLLPDVTTSVYSGGSLEKDPNARIIFSTYQSMINLINDETKEFGIGRFDLIIIDEAHRSIFSRYGQLFNYFDAIMLGLTATPRDENNKNTYDFFGLPDHKPDYAYELNQAIMEGYLVGFETKDRTTERIRTGLRWAELSDDEKLRVDSLFDDDENPETAVFQGSAIFNRWVNKSTIDIMLNDLMTEGRKIESGEKLGKTIIFAGSHFHADWIVKEFNALYPSYGPDFCQLIDSQTQGSQQRIDRFGERNNLPQIAVSVDMLDTGIDVPDVLNLVFFKKVRSKIKFMQMIGRGTRLSPDVYGPGEDKDNFVIFDYGDNLEYFGVTAMNPEGTNKTGKSGKTGKGRPGLSMHQRSLRYRTSLLHQLQEASELTPFESDYLAQTKKVLHNSVINLVNDVVAVQYNMEFVNYYRTEAAWDHIDESREKDINQYILPLIPSTGENILIKAWDCLLYMMEADFKAQQNKGAEAETIKTLMDRYCSAIDSRVKDLLKQKTIPAILAKEKELQRMQNAEYLMADLSLERAEEVRKDLRDLMVYLPKKLAYVALDGEDTLIYKDGSPTPPTVPYSQRFNDYLYNSNDPKLVKIMTLDELTDDEKAELDDIFRNQIGTPAEFTAFAGNTALLPFLRMKLGIDDQAIQTKFGSFLNENFLDEHQLAVMNQIIDFAKVNGDISMLDVNNTSPFSGMDMSKIFGDKMNYIKDLVNGLHKPVM